MNYFNAIQEINTSNARMLPGCQVARRTHVMQIMNLG
jgi:hypothetical protein